MKTPTPQDISRLLREAGFERSDSGQPGVMWNRASTGYRVWKSHHASAPQQPFVAVMHVIKDSHYADDEERTEVYREMRGRLEQYAAVIREAGYPALVRDRGTEPPWLTILTVVGSGRPLAARER
jgi:hypothetical protein